MLGGVAAATASVTAIGQAIRRSADSANRYLRDEIREQTRGQTEVLTARITDVDTRTSLAIAVTVAAAAGAAAVLGVLVLRRISWPAAAMAARAMMATGARR